MVQNIGGGVLFDENSLKLFIIKQEICLRLIKGDLPRISLPSKRILEHLDKNRKYYDDLIIDYRHYGVTGLDYIEIQENGKEISCNGYSIKLKNIVERPNKHFVEYLLINSNLVLKYNVRINYRKYPVFEISIKGKYVEGKENLEYKILNRKYFDKNIFDLQLRQAKYLSNKMLTLGIRM